VLRKYIYSNKFEINRTPTHSANSRDNAVRTLPKIFAINFDQAGIKYVLVIKRDRTILGECLVAEVSPAGNRLELRPFVSEFRCATLSNGQQRECAHPPTCLTFQPILAVGITTGRYSWKIRESLWNEFLKQKKGYTVKR